MRLQISMTVKLWYVSTVVVVSMASMNTHVGVSQDIMASSVKQVSGVFIEAISC